MNDVTIAIKTFERPESLKNLLQSIRQFYQDMYIIIADDSKKPYAQEIASCFSNIECISLRFDIGISAGRNAMLSRIKTKYFVLCDDDIIFFEKTKLEDFKKILDETDIELVGGILVDRSGTGKFDKPNMYAGNLIIDSGRNLRIEAVKPDKEFVRCDIANNFFMARTQSVLLKTGGWDPRLKISEHTDFYWTAKNRGLRVAFTPKVSVNHMGGHPPKYYFYRHTRKSKYLLMYFKKLNIRSFTDNWGTINLNDIQPWWHKFIFQQKCIPKSFSEKWRNLRKGDQPFLNRIWSWLVYFVTRQKCMPWFVIQMWRKFKGYL